MTETRKRRIVRHVRAHKRVYGVLTAGVLMGLFGDFLLGVLGNLAASIVGPVFGIK